jgi:hypothetical protein
MFPHSKSPPRKQKLETSILKASSTSTEKKNPNPEYLSIICHNPSNDANQILYITPKVCLEPSDKIFHPQDWNIDRF